MVDYCERYGENITAVCAEQGAPRAMKGSATAAVIEAAQRARVPKESLAVCLSSYIYLPWWAPPTPPTRVNIAVS